MQRPFLFPDIALQTEIGNQLYTALRGDVVLPLFVTGEGAQYSHLQHDLRQLGVQVSGLMAENEERLKVFMEDHGEMFGDHPVLPIRVHALNTCVPKVL